jgi:copper(I)-binding protein
MKAGSIGVVLGIALLLGCQKAPTVTGAAAAVGDLAIRDGVAWGLASSRSSTVGFRVTAATADTLVAVSSPDGVAMLHDNTDGGMRALDRLPVAAGEAIVLGAGGPHIMLTEATHGFARGDSVRIVLQWARNGRLALTVPLRNYSDASGLLEGR